MVAVVVFFAEAGALALPARAFPAGFFAVAAFAGFAGAALAAGFFVAAGLVADLEGGLEF